MSRASRRLLRAVVLAAPLVVAGVAVVTGPVPVRVVAAQPSGSVSTVTVGGNTADGNTAGDGWFKPAGGHLVSTFGSPA